MSDAVRLFSLIKKKKTRKRKISPTPPYKEKEIKEKEKAAAAAFQADEVSSACEGEAAAEILNTHEF